MKKSFSGYLSVLLIILMLCTGAVGCNRQQTDAAPTASPTASAPAGTAPSVETTTPAPSDQAIITPTTLPTAINTQTPPKTTPAPTFNPSKLTEVDVLFVDNGLMPTLPLHFSRLDQDKKVNITLLSRSNYFLAAHASALKESPQEKAFDQVDAVILQEYGGGVPIYTSAEELMKIIGQDKAYYGFTVYPEADAGFSEDEIRELEKVGVQLILTPILQYAPELAMSDFLHSDMITPTNLYSYTISLALYCRIFDVKAIDQNNGALSAYDIPGATRQEEDAYMAKLKKAVQHMLDAQ